MKNARVVMTDDQHAEISALAKAAGFSGVGPYLLSLACGSGDRDEVVQIVEKARIPAMTGTTIGKAFRLRSLFEKTEWEAHAKHIRLGAGKLFFAEVSAGRLPGVRVAAVTSSNHQTYIRER